MSEKLKRNSLWTAQCNDIHFFFRDLIIHWHLTTDMIHLPESQKNNDNNIAYELYPF